MLYNQLHQWLYFGHNSVPVYSRSTHRHALQFQYFISTAYAAYQLGKIPTISAPSDRRVHPADSPGYALGPGLACPFPLSIRCLNLEQLVMFSMTQKAALENLIITHI